MPCFANDNDYEGAPKGKRDGVISHIFERENGNWMEKIASFRE